MEDNANMSYTHMWLYSVGGGAPTNIQCSVSVFLSYIIGILGCSVNPCP